MNKTVIIEKDSLKFPKGLLRKLHLQNGQKLIIETAPDNTIQIKPLPKKDTNLKLLKLLETPAHMGKIKYNNRQGIYDDIA